MSAVVTDLDQTLVDGTEANPRVLAWLRAAKADGKEVLVVSGRQTERLAETRRWLSEHGVPADEVYLNDFPAGPNAATAFKLYKAEKLLEEGVEIEAWVDDNADVREGLDALGINAVAQTELPDLLTENEDEDEKAFQKITAPTWLRENARRGLEWYKEGLGGDGLVPRTISEAQDMASGFVSEEKAVRMAAWFARHMVDIEGIDSDETDPTPGMVAHALWGGWPRSESERAQAWAESNANNANAATVTRDGKDGTHSTGETHMQFKTYNATLTTDAKAGTVEAVVSVFNNVDLVGDRMMPGAFSKSLQDYQATGRTIPFVWSHDYDTPESYIGKVIEARETSEGLHVKAELFDTPRAQVVRELLVNRVVSEFSFAYDIVDQQKAADGANELLQVRLLECGPTLRGANPMTRLIDAKASNVEAQKTDKPKPILAALPDNYRPALSEDVPEGRACGNCAFYDETNLNEAGDKAYCTRWDDYADGGGYCNAWQANDDNEEVETAQTPKLQGTKAGRTLSSKNEAHLAEACDLLKQAQDTLAVVLSSVQASNTDEVKTEELPEMEAKAEELTVTDTSALLALLKLYALEN